MVEENLCVSSFGKPLAVLAAVSQGYFRLHGLGVEYERTTGSAEQIQRLIAGEVDIAHTAIDNVIAYVDAGEELVAFLALELGIVQKLVVGQDVGDYQDLVGRALGVDAVSTGYAFVLREMLARNGLEGDSYHLVGVGGSADRARLLAEGSIAGTLLASPHDWPIAEANCHVLDHASRYLPEYPNVTAATTMKVAVARSDALVRYVAAMAAGQRWAVEPANSARAIDLIARMRGVREEVAEQQYVEEVASQPVATIQDVLRSVGVVRQLRSKMTAGTGGRAPVDAYFDGGFMSAAGFDLGVVVA